MSYTLYEIRCTLNVKLIATYWHLQLQKRQKTKGKVQSMYKVQCTKNKEQRTPKPKPSSLEGSSM
jgi:hypothetical protein